MKLVEYEIVKEHFKNRKSINIDDFINFIITNFENRDLKYKRLYISHFHSKKIYYRYNSKILKPFNNKYEFTFNYEEEIKNDLLNMNLDLDCEILYWDLSTLNRVTSMQLFSSLKIVEVPSYAIDIILEKFKILGRDVVLVKDYYDMMKYSNSKDKIILKSYYTKDSPIHNRGFSLTNGLLCKVTTPKIEKIFVDLFIDKFLISIFESEMTNIFYNLLKEHPINFTTVMRYAKKRKVDTKIISFLEYLNFDIKSGEFN